MPSAAQSPFRSAAPTAETDDALSRFGPKFVPTVKKRSRAKRITVVCMLLILLGIAGVKIAQFISSHLEASREADIWQEQQKQLAADVQATIATARRTRDEGNVDEARGMLLDKLATVGAFDDQNVRSALHEELKTYPQIVTAPSPDTPENESAK
jgi:hypothetical protein